MTAYEKQVRHNLTDTSADSLTLKQLMQMEPELHEDVLLDYGEIEGDLRLRAEILSFYRNQDENSLLITQGCLMANYMAMEAILEPGDHVITAFPYYQQFIDVPKMLGCELTLLKLDETDGWSYPIRQLEEAIRENTRLLILNNPHNPTGSALDEQELQKIVKICRMHGIYILCDEVYRDFDGEIPSLSDLYEKGISTSSVSKVLGLPGLRLGWLKGDPEIIHRVEIQKDYNVISTGQLSDRLALIALKHRDEIRKRIENTVAENRMVYDEWVRNSEVFELEAPADSQVAFLKYRKDIPSEKLARALIEEESIFFVPGTCFGMEGHLRIGLGKHQDNLREVLQRTENFVKSMPESGCGEKK